MIADNFITDIIDNDNETGYYDSRVQTRFPPEPNGYLHIGHAKSMTLNFSLAQRYNGICNLRFDDTNPAKEETEYADAIKEDIEWLGFKWANLYYASDYFDKLYEYAVDLIKQGLAYVCDLTPEEMKEYRGTLTEPGKNSPYRDRNVEENLQLFEEMKAGKYKDGEKVLRAKVDMAHPNMNMRDPAMYRILHKEHHRTGNKWCIYPMYDYAHPVSDAIEGVTHSVCTLEFEAHRPIYEWFVNHLDFKTPPKQIEFARLNLTGTIMSKRYLKQLVDSGVTAGWDDPRMPTICGLRRRGYTPEAIREFCARIGIAKANSEVDYAMLESCLRDDLGERANRAMAVLEPIKVIITNMEDDFLEEIELENNPNDEGAGKRILEFTKELYIERGDFEIDPPKKFHRLKPEGEVRLKGAYIIKCEDYKTDENGNV
ncbi:MAG: glutamine--tRNA ligase/YqeY domain fusion protein, partial [Clostridia bacterium]|nr:glutamine--tRNA ligase/YqeY domain fusion protein [Clostridia bacterium]